MSMRILSEEDVRKRLAETEIKINRVKRIKAPGMQIKLAKAEKATWKRMLHHIKNGEIITLDDENRIQWHIDAGNA